jgi:hypothetical protein
VTTSMEWRWENLAQNWSDWADLKGVERLEKHWNTHEALYRRHLITALALLRPFGSLYEIGCGAGPNLRLVQIVDPRIKLGGCDLHAGTATFASEKLGTHIDYATLPDDLNLEPRSWDVLLSCYTLAYLHPTDACDTVQRMASAANKAMIFMEPQPVPNVRGRAEIPEWIHDYAKLTEDTPFTLTWRWPVVPPVENLNAISIYVRN